MTKALFFLSLFFIFCLDLSSQEMKLYFKNLHRSHYESGSTQPIYKLFVDDIGKTFPIKLPNIKNFQDTAFFRVFFRGQKVGGAYSNGLAVLYANYKSDTSYIYLDQNNNLDFTDDNNVQMITNKKKEFFLKLVNHNHPNSSVNYHYQKADYSDTTLYKSDKDYYYNENPEAGDVTMDMDYWLEDRRLNLLSCDTIIDGQKIQVGLMDWNCNGLYNDMDTISGNNLNPDRILFAEYGNKILSYKPSDGAIILLPKTEFQINGIVYEVVEIEPAGAYMRILKTNRKYNSLKVGDELPTLDFDLVGGTKSTLNQHLIKGKYNLIDIWAYWCSGCIEAVNTMKDLLKKYPNKLNIIGLHQPEAYGKEADSFAQKHEINWTLGINNNKIGKALLAPGGYPYYVLIEPKGKIAKFDVKLNELEDFIKTDR